MKKLLASLLYGILFLTSLLPLWVHYLISDMFYVLIYKVVHYRVKLVRKNLSDSFPEKTEKEIRDIERRFYHWFCDYLVETVKLLTISEKQLKRRMVFNGAEAIDQLVKEGRSAAIYLGHYCNWEWVTSLPLWVTTEAHCGQIYHALENKEFDMLFLKLRQRFNAVCIPMAETLRRIVKYKQEGKPMNRSEIAEIVANKLEISNTSADNAVKAVMEAIAKGLASSGRVVIPQFGTFAVTRRKARQYRVPSTGEMIMTEGKNVVVFRAAKAVKDAIK